MDELQENLNIDSFKWCLLFLCAGYWSRNAKAIYGLNCFELCVFCGRIEQPIRGNELLHTHNGSNYCCVLIGFGALAQARLNSFF